MGIPVSTCLAHIHLSTIDIPISKGVRNPLKHASRFDADAFRFWLDAYTKQVLGLNYFLMPVLMNFKNCSNMDTFGEE
jgi:hypothetical protein